jgi:imidazolonepropionase-like amidohydrolase
MRITNVSVLDTESGTAQPDQTVDLIGERIGRIGSASAGDNGRTDDLIMEGRGLVLLPGLIDCHVHLSHDGEPNWMTRGPRTPAEETLDVVHNAKRALSAGVTTVRDCGSGPTRVPLTLALKPSTHELLLPRVISCGSPITMTGGHLYWEAVEADGVEQVRKAVRAELKAGAQWIKIIATGGVLTPGTDIGGESYTQEEVAAATAEAGRAGRRVAAHAIGNAGIKNALRAGVSTIEHGSFMDDQALELMLEAGAYHVPTLSAYHHVVTEGIDAGIPAESVAKALGAHETNLESFARSLRAGVPVAAGTDAGTPHNPHGELAVELELMVKGGASPLQALQAATTRAAAALDLSAELGTVEIGKRADLILVEGNPLDDITALARPLAVVKDGMLAFAADSLIQAPATENLAAGRP